MKIIVLGEPQFSKLAYNYKYSHKHCTDYEAPFTNMPSYYHYWLRIRYPYFKNI